MEKVVKKPAEKRISQFCAKSAILESDDDDEEDMDLDEVCAAENTEPNTCSMFTTGESAEKAKPSW